MKEKTHDWHVGYRVGFAFGMALAWVFVILGHIAS